LGNFLVGGEDIGGASSGGFNGVLTAVSPPESVPVLLGGTLAAMVGKGGGLLVVFLGVPRLVDGVPRPIWLGEPIRALEKLTGVAFWLLLSFDLVLGVLAMVVVNSGDDSNGNGCGLAALI